MEHIFHEKQEGRLCAQHCLNSLLQGPYFGPVELSDLALNIDNLERIRMAESGTESQSYRDFLQAPSENVDDSGYFSLEVLNAALIPWNLELVPYNCSEERARRAKENPASMSAFICNYHEHWFTIRKIGHQWFNLDSTFKRPKLLSETYLDIYLAQIMAEGYSIFIVFGDLPPCEADEILNACPVTEMPSATTSNSNIEINEINEDEDERNLKLALQMSLRETQNNNLIFNSRGIRPDERNYRTNLYNYLGIEDKDVDVEEIRKKRMQHFASQTK